MQVKFNSFGSDVNDFKRAHPYDVGLDVRLFHDMILKPHETKTDGLGFGIELPATYAGLLMSRSGMVKKGLISQLAPVDPGYTGEWHISITNHSNEQVELKAGERVAQIVVVPTLAIEPVSEIEDNRGDNGLGSTGVK